MILPRRSKLGLSFIMLGLLVVGGWTLWSDTRNWEPVTQPISLFGGNVQATEFKLNVNALYTIEVEASRKLPYERLNCLLGVEDIYPERCKDVPSVVTASWVLRSGGHVVAQGSTDTYKGGSWTNDTIAREVGSFRGQRGRNYILETTILEDGSALAVTEPRVRVRVPGTVYVDNIVSTIFVIFGAGVCVLIGMILLIVERVTKYRDTTSVIGSLSTG